MFGGRDVAIGERVHERGVDLTELGNVDRAVELPAEDFVKGFVRCVGVGEGKRRGGGEEGI